MRTLQIIIILFFITIVLVFCKTGKKEVSYVTSDVDGRQYLVRDLDDKQMAANMLARIRKNIMTLTDYLEAGKDTIYKDFEPYIEQLSNKIQGVVINESSEDSMYTSYSVNKGEQIVFCLRSKKNKNELHDLNLLMYVAIHEISHVGCPEFNHTPLFKRIFAFFTQVAIDKGLYKKIDFEMDPVEYCGLDISESII